MAEEATTSEAATLRFTATAGIYGVLPGATAIDLCDQLSARLSQLRSMLGMVYGAGFESFHDTAPSDQEHYLWACASAAKECEQLHDLICARRAAESTPGQGRDPLPERA